MSLSTMHLPAQVWPVWLPGAVAKAEQSLFVIARARSQLSPVKHQTLPPLSATLQSSSTKAPTSILSSSPPRPSPLLTNQQIRSASQLPLPLHRSYPSIRPFSTSPNSPPLPTPPLKPETTSTPTTKPPTEPRPSKWVPPSNISIHTRPVAIIGAGVLGRRLAVIWASHGSPVVLYDTSPAALTSATTYIADTLSSYCSIQGTHPGKIHFTTSLADACTNPWMCIEAVPEVLELKISILGRLDRTVPTDCVIATNSSSFPSSQLISEVSHRERVLNTLYYIPPENKCVELMPNNYTSSLLPPFLTTQLLNINLSPITIPKPSSGLIFPRLFSALKREALALLADGTARPEEIDELFRDFFGAKKGVCQKMDEVGLDTVLAVEKHFAEVEREKRENGEVMSGGWNEEPEELKWLEREFVNEGRLGDKCEKGGLLTKGWTVGEERKEEKAGDERWKEHAVDLSGL